MNVIGCGSCGWCGCCCDQKVVDNTWRSRFCRTTCEAVSFKSWTEWQCSWLSQQYLKAQAVQVVNWNYWLFQLAKKCFKIFSYVYLYLVLKTCVSGFFHTAPQEARWHGFKNLQTLWLDGCFWRFLEISGDFELAFSNKPQGFREWIGDFTSVDWQIARWKWSVPGSLQQGLIIKI